MNQTNNKGFTLVELIVVITILAILGTIAFISLQGYSKTARDSKRISDVNNIKTSLELFILNTGKYPLPDNGEEVSYGLELLWIQGTVGDVVSRNLSKNLNKKPLDPLLETEYVYSVSNTKKEFELLSFYEGVVANNNISNIANAASNYTPKISGSYNGVFIKTPTTIVPIPSIITSEELPLTIDAQTIQSQVISGGDNFPNINNQTTTGALDIILSPTPLVTKDSTQEEKIIAIEAIQNAYSGTTMSNYFSFLLSSTTEEEKFSLVENIMFNDGTPEDFEPLRTFTLSGILIGFGDTSTISNNCSVAPTNYTSSDNGIAEISGTTITGITEGTVEITPVGGDCEDSLPKTLTVTYILPTSCHNGQNILFTYAQANKLTIIANIDDYLGCAINDYAGSSIPGSGVYIAGFTNTGADIMVVAKSDISSTKPWRTTNTTTPGTTSYTDGLANTNAMVTAGISVHWAGKSCKDIGTNWYFPAKDELSIIYDNKSSLGVFADSTYSSSTEYNSSNVWVQSFLNSSKFYYGKTNYVYVRCASRF